MAPNSEINTILGDLSFVQRHQRSPSLYDSESSRIDAHLFYVETLLNSKPSDLLNSRAKAQRRFLIDQLCSYRQAGVFPINRGEAPHRTPIFIDACGTPCAVAHLLIASGEEELATDIDRKHHLSLIGNIDDERLNAWASYHGFSLEELAMIQPGYDTYAFCAWVAIGESILWLGIQSILGIAALVLFFLAPDDASDSSQAYLFWMGIMGVFSTSPCFLTMFARPISRLLRSCCDILPACCKIDPYGSSWYRFSNLMGNIFGCFLILTSIAFIVLSILLGEEVVDNATSWEGSLKIFVIVVWAVSATLIVAGVSYCCGMFWCCFVAPGSMWEERSPIIDDNDGARKKLTG